ncbi:HNH endonuclease [Lactococcus piscium]|nr:HNH endonuclease [Lactococcus paracarnosus]MCJ1993792.1 HNH endonuclease [Lactococcus paracarnosus]
MRLHRCAEIRCRELIATKYSYCQIHYDRRLSSYLSDRAERSLREADSMRGKYTQAEQNKEYDNTRRKELHDGFYQTKQWKKVSEYVKGRDNYTDAIDRKVWDKGDLIADHIIPRRLLDKDKQLDTENLWLLTKPHHNKKTAIENKLKPEQLKKVGRDWWIKVLKNKK